jgi:hypothetical protein
MLNMHASIHDAVLCILLFANIMLTAALLLLLLLLLILAFADGTTVAMTSSVVPSSQAQPPLKSLTARNL